MLEKAAYEGARAAAARFNVREGSGLLETILGTVGAGVGGSVARGALNAASPKLMTALENVGAAPVNAVRRMFAGPSTPAEAFVKHLNAAQPMMPKAPIT